MKFNLIQMETWERKEYYNHYINNIVCTYSVTVNLNITNLVGQKIYPAMLWLLTDTVNELKEFRTSLSLDGLGIYEDMNPSYTIFNKENKNFSEIWTKFEKDYNKFLALYEKDSENYSTSTKLSPKTDQPRNVFNVSMLPWVTFSAFNLNIHSDGKYLLPIFTMGKTFIQEEKTMLPLAIQVHHAICDGYHVGVFVETLQKKIDSFIK
ncbi:MAG: CatA-like O-acetyltransferase [Fusobacteriaceae bacterium]